METTIKPRSGTAFILRKGQRLKVIDPEGEQVSDIYCFNLDNKEEFLSSGRSLDYNESVAFGKGSKLYSNQSNIMLEIVEDTVERHDFLLTPCSKDTFRHFYPDEEPVPGCYGNLVHAFSEFNIPEHYVGTTFNIFMNVEIDKNGGISVLPPTSKAGDYTTFEAKMDLIVGLTACSAGESNNFKYKPIHYSVLDPL
ncbi:urea carboxylase-associated family protein [Alteromonas ponticola]|uniref:Urea carboxylase-associated family protein n=1 Tax=Alteromonas aquimaris TaxID=2998417 RepID=A0ABT3PAL1_9ALTE|nr:urea carboxylase-associated family protein [Alteromonas aquimaris]MCW8109575.1 urea carboxylase-associated family protein [Alteromonas aquimaris]